MLVSVSTSSLSTSLLLPIGLLQVQQSQEKIARLEQEKEHWLLEAQLGKVRLEKENQRIAELEAQLAAALGGSPNSQTAAAGALTRGHEEAAAELKAAEKEPTLCTSLVLLRNRSVCCLLSLCRGNFVSLALICFNKGSIIVVFFWLPH